MGFDHSIDAISSEKHHNLRNIKYQESMRLAYSLRTA